MKRDFLVDILLSELSRTGRVDYNYLQNALSLSPATVIGLLQELLREEVLVSVDHNLEIAQTQQDESYLHQLYDLVHTTQQKKSEEPFLRPFTEEVYIPTNFNDYFGHKPQGD